MREHHIRHIPVVSPEGSVVGVVSHRDVLAASDSRLLHEDASSAGKEAYVALSSVMSSPVQTVTDPMPASSAWPSSCASSEWAACR
jgi:CBS domain-containing membrane protein